eukprot:PLAT4965.1.p1 GENE.PLAT4965.1~~PLAT4965.1.p1  ORF type:complete len:1865 (-),score=744.73 PLAT4965.1:152-5044(-)
MPHTPAVSSLLPPTAPVGDAAELEDEFEHTSAAVEEAAAGEEVKLPVEEAAMPHTPAVSSLLPPTAPAGEAVELEDEVEHTSAAVEEAAAGEEAKPPVDESAMLHTSAVSSLLPPTAPAAEAAELEEAAGGVEASAVTEDSDDTEDVVYSHAAEPPAAPAEPAAAEPVTRQLAEPPSLRLASEAVAVPLSIAVPRDSGHAIDSAASPSTPRIIATRSSGTPRIISSSIAASPAPSASSLSSFLPPAGGRELDADEMSEADIDAAAAAAVSALGLPTDMPSSATAPDGSPKRRPRRSAGEALDRRRASKRRPRRSAGARSPRRSASSKRRPRRSAAAGTARRSASTKRRPRHSASSGRQPRPSASGRRRPRRSAAAAAGDYGGRYHEIGDASDDYDDYGEEDGDYADRRGRRQKRRPSRQPEGKNGGVRGPPVATGGGRGARGRGGGHRHGRHPRGRAAKLASASGGAASGSTSALLEHDHAASKHAKQLRTRHSVAVAGEADRRGSHRPAVDAIREGSLAAPATPTARAKGIRASFMRRAVQRRPTAGHGAGDSDHALTLGRREGLGEDYLDTPYVTPNFHAARMWARMHTFGLGRAPLLRTSLERMSTMGIGVSLYFRFLLFTAVVCACMSIAMLPSMLLNLNGDGLPAEAMDPLQLSKLTLGNQADPAAELDCAHVNDPACSRPLTMALLGVTMTREDAGRLALGSEIVLILFFFFYLSLLRLRVRQSVQEDNIRNVNAREYSIAVRGLPLDATEQEVQEHFEEVIDSRDDAPDLISDYSHNGKEQYEGGYVADVSIVGPHAARIRAFQSSHKLYTRLREARARVKWLLSQGFGMLSSECRSAFRVVERLAKEYSRSEAARAAAASGLKHRSSASAVSASSIALRSRTRARVLPSGSSSHDIRAGGDTSCHGAYITFDAPRSAAWALEDYRGSSSWLARSLQSEKLRFRGTVPLEVIPAPNPSDILWEHLDCSAREKLARRLATALLTLLLLVVSFIAVFATQAATKDLGEQLPASRTCVSDLPATLLGGYNFSSQLLPPLALNGSSAAAASCSSGHHQFFYPAQQLPAPLQKLPGAAEASLPVPDGNRSAAIASAQHIGLLYASSNGSSMDGCLLCQRGSCAGECVAPACLTGCSALETAGSCPTRACYDSNEDAALCRRLPRSTAARCYCVAQLQQSISQLGLFAGAERMLAAEDDPIGCGRFASSLLLAQTATIISSLVITVVNSVLRIVMAAVARFERHSSISRQSSSTMSKVLLAHVLNTAGILLVVNARLPDGASNGLAQLGLLTGEHAELTARWYSSVGFSLTLTMMINVVAPHIAPLLHWLVVAPIVRATVTPYTQSKLREQQLGPVFHLEVRYATTLSTFTVSFMFAAGIPLLLPVACAAMLLTYWVDKLLLLRFYRQPPQYDSQLSEQVVTTLQWALLVHLLMTAWMFSTPQVLRSGQLDVDAFLPGTSKSLEGSAVATAIINRGARTIVAPVLFAGIIMLLHLLVSKPLLALLGRCRRSLCPFTIKADEAAAGYHGGPGWTRPYRRMLRSFGDNTLTEADAAAGWRVETRRGKAAAYKVHLQASEVNGFARRTEQRKLTWEVVSDSALHSYRIESNDRYSQALLGTSSAVSRVFVAP